MTIPMLLTLTRLLFSMPAVFAILELEEPTWLWVGSSLAVFTALCLTDFFDGLLARKSGKTSVWGKILDPIADKVFVVGTIFALLYFHDVHRVFVLLLCFIVFRELFVSGVREGFAGTINLPVTRLAKWKTTSQMVALGALISGDALGKLFESVYLFSFFVPAVFLGVAFYLTVRTGIDYLYAALTRSLGQSRDNRGRFEPHVRR